MEVKGSPDAKSRPAVAAGAAGAGAAAAGGGRARHGRAAGASGGAARSSPERLKRGAAPLRCVGWVEAGR